MSHVSYSPPNLDTEVLSVGPLHNRMGLFQAVQNGGGVSATWPLSLLLIATPFYVRTGCTAQQFVLSNGAAVGNNFDVGIYNEAGTSKLASSGSTAQSGTNAVQAVAISGGLYLPRGRYWLALCFNGTTSTMVKLGPSAAVTRLDRAFGISEQTLGALPLPASLTFGIPSHDYIPCVEVYLSTLTV